MRQELRAGGWRREQSHAAAQAIKWLMHMSPQNAAHRAVRVDDAEELLGIVEADLVQPIAGHRHGMMMQADQYRSGCRGQRLLEQLQLCWRQVTAVLSGYAAVQQHQAPTTKIKGASRNERRIGERLRQRRR